MTSHQRVSWFPWVFTGGQNLQTVLLIRGHRVSFLRVGSQKYPRNCLTVPWQPFITLQHCGRDVLHVLYLCLFVLLFAIYKVTFSAKLLGFLFNCQIYIRTQKHYYTSSPFVLILARSSVCCWQCTGASSSLFVFLFPHGIKLFVFVICVGDFFFPTRAVGVWTHSWLYRDALWFMGLLCLTL